jgi:cbb3-type cytochrome oxidase subunit 3
MNQLKGRTMLSVALETDYHVEIYALVGFVIFFTFFILVTINAFRMKKKEEREISNLPLDEKDEESANEKDRTVH